MRVERVDIGPAPPRPLAQWAKRSSETSEGLKNVAEKAANRLSGDTKVDDNEDKKVEEQ